MRNMWRQRQPRHLHIQLKAKLGKHKSIESQNTCDVTEARWSWTMTRSVLEVLTNSGASGADYFCQIFIYWYFSYGQQCTCRTINLTMIFCWWESGMDWLPKRRKSRPLYSDWWGRHSQVQLNYWMGREKLFTSTCSKSKSVKEPTCRVDLPDYEWVPESNFLVKNSTYRLLFLASLPSPSLFSSVSIVPGWYCLSSLSTNSTAYKR